MTSVIGDAKNERPADGGYSCAAAQEPPTPDQIVLDFLRAMEARDFVTAESLLASEFEMTFPGGRKMAKIAELVDWATGRYRFVRKTIAFTEIAQKETYAIVYLGGTLSGEWPDGEAFSGIRFIDRFKVSQGRLFSQDVWNDVAEVRGR